MRNQISHRPWLSSTDENARRSIHLNIDAELLSAARAMDIDPALVLEEALREMLGAEQSPAEQEPAPALANGW